MLVRSSLASPWWIPRWLVRLGYRIVDILIDAALASPINELRAELGQAPVTRIMDRWWNSSDLVLACFPDWLSPARADWPAKCQQVGFPDFNPQHGQALSAEVESFLDSGDAPIIFAHSAAVKQLDGFVDHSIAAARTMGYRSIFLGVDPPDHHEADVCFRPAEPHHLLLPRSAALVHHGGLGTALAAIRAGIPQLCVPQMLDQPANARSITQLGMGNTLSWKRYRASDLVRKLKPLLVEPRYREATRRYQQLLRSAPNACEQAADAIEAIFPTAEGSTGSRPS
jgi:UDP:flavonoid glycosyltransferase YjiC (YdhE family)